MASARSEKSRDAGRSAGSDLASGKTVRSLVQAEDHPGLAAVLDGPNGARLAAELENLLGRHVTPRAARRSIKRIARLSCVGFDYDEVVLLKDMSATGVRLLIRGDQPLDVRSTLDMFLTVQLRSGRRRLPVALVRVCGREGEQLDLGLRFLDLDPEREEMVQEIRSHIFGS